MMSDPLGWHQYCFTPLTAAIVDIPKALMYAGISPRASPVTMDAYKQFGDAFQHTPRMVSTTLAQLMEIEATDIWVDLIPSGFQSWIIGEKLTLSFDNHWWKVEWIDIQFLSIQHFSPYTHSKYKKFTIKDYEFQKGWHPEWHLIPRLKQSRKSVTKFLNNIVSSYWDLPRNKKVKNMYVWKYVQNVMLSNNSLDIQY